MDEQNLKHHLLKQLIHHHQGADAETLVQKTADSAGVHPDACRENVLDWINYLTATGHLKHKGDTITAADVSHLQAVHEHLEMRRDAAVSMSSPALMSFFTNEARW